LTADDEDNQGLALTPIIPANTTAEVSYEGKIKGTSNENKFLADPRRGVAAGHGPHAEHGQFLFLPLI
jgi:hypothetical protein